MQIQNYTYVYFECSEVAYHYLEQLFPWGLGHSEINKYSSDVPFFWWEAKSFLDIVSIS